MEQTAVRPDRRVIRTKRAIHRAMAKLMTEKDVNAISVTDIAELADVNRKTFYNYYAGVYQLVDEMENEIVEYFADLIRSTDFAQALADPSVIFDTLYETISKHVDIIDALFNSGNNASLINKVLGKLIEMTSDAAVQQFKSDPEKTEIIIRFIFSGEIAAYQAWYRSGRKMPVKELAGTIQTLCMKGLDGLLGSEA